MRRGVVRRLPREGKQSTHAFVPSVVGSHLSTEGWGGALICFAQQGNQIDLALVCDFAKGSQGGVALASFDLANIGAIHACEEG